MRNCVKLFYAIYFTRYILRIPIIDGEMTDVCNRKKRRLNSNNFNARFMLCYDKLSIKCNARAKFNIGPFSQIEFSFGSMIGVARFSREYHIIIFLS